MNLSQIKSIFHFTRSQRIGVALLLSVILAIQAILLVNHSSEKPTPGDNSHIQVVQAEIDSLKNAPPQKPVVYPFNPNFITDYKGYKLGMSVAEIDRLFAFRKTNRYVNSAAEFQLVTGISDSLLKTMAPAFKFPEWVSQRKNKSNFKKMEADKPKIVVVDINNASAEDLIKVYGIGPALSERILKNKELLGGYVSMEQMHDVWGISPEVVDNLKKHFNVVSIPVLKKINVNTASMKELSQFPYFRYPLSKSIVTYRSMNGNIANIADLAKIPHFPLEKIDRIAVYLEF